MAGQAEHRHWMMVEEAERAAKYGSPTRVKTPTVTELVTAVFDPVTHEVNFDALRKLVRRDTTTDRVALMKVLEKDAGAVVRGAFGVSVTVSVIIGGWGVGGGKELMLV